ncbi:MAG: PAS domain S-box protein [Deltaproteobacteria bacterium]|nr:PAS domain S-box protein [Deltaproteobacteria bacterium]
MAVSDRSNVARRGIPINKKQFLTLFELLPEGIVILDTDDGWFSVNSALARLVDHSRATLRHAGRRKDPTLLNRCFADPAIWDKICLQGCVTNLETNLVRKGGDRITAIVNGAVIHKRGNGRHVVGMSILDITEHKKMARRLLRTKSELRRLKQQLESTLEDLGTAQRFLQESSRNLEKKSQATKVVMSRAEQNNRELKRSIAHNVDMLITPLIEHLKSTSLTEAQRHLVETLDFNVQHLTSQFGIAVAYGLKGLTPRGIQICKMIWEGKNSREIADAMGVTYLTVITQRKDIRRRLGLAKKKQNLASFIKQVM